MMENAGASVALFVRELFENNQRDGESRPRVVLVAGTGNNGGDVFVAARHLAFWGMELETSLILVGKVENIRADEANINWKILTNYDQIVKIIVDTEEKFPILDQHFAEADAIVAGIFGTGFKGKPKELQRQVIQKINESGQAQVISVDLPSGMDADSGVYELAVKSTFTIAMHAPKTGVLSESGKQVCGQILVANIGIPR